MEVLFLEVLSRGFAASFLILAVLAVRFLIKGAPRWITCLLWAMVGIRLLCPFVITSPLSLVPGEVLIAKDVLQSDLTANTGTVQSVAGTAIGESKNDEGAAAEAESIHSTESSAIYPAASVRFQRILYYVAGRVWVLGMLLLFLYAAVGYLRLYRKIRASLNIDSNLYLCDEIDTPFLFGIFSPHIYIPSGLSEGELQHVIAHERAHLARKDHLWKPLGFLILTVYWFHPLVWLSYMLFCRDIELACDEKVIQNYGRELAVSYSQALLACSVSRRTILMCPLAFGEVSVKERVKHVLNYKKPAFWVILAALVGCLAVGICFLTNPSQKAGGAQSSGDVLQKPGNDSETALGIGVPGKEKWLDGDGEVRTEFLLEYLAELPEDPRNLARAGITVLTGDEDYGVEHPAEFMEAYRGGQTALLVVCQYTVEGDLIPGCAAYNGREITVIRDWRRDRFAGSPEAKVYVYPYVSLLEEELPEYHYQLLLAHKKEEVTMEDYMKKMTSSTLEPSVPEILSIGVVRLP